MPIGCPPAVIGVPAAGSGAVAGRDDEPPPRRAAMLHARDDLLADVAALAEVDAAELVHVGVVREGVAEGEVDAAFRHAERDAVRVVVGLARLVEIRRHVGAGRHDGAEAERGEPRIGRDRPVERSAASSLPHAATTMRSSERSAISTLARSR